MNHIKAQDAAIAYHFNHVMIKILMGIHVTDGKGNVLSKAGRIAGTSMDLIAMIATALVEQHKQHGMTPSTAIVTQWLLKQTLEPFSSKWTNHTLTAEEHSQFMTELANATQQCRKASDELITIHGPFQKEEPMRRLAKTMASS